MVRRVLVILLVCICGVGVVVYQATRPPRATAAPSVFVPSPRFFLDFSPSFRTTIADAYYLRMVQYYGEHVNADGRLDSLPAMIDLVTTLSPHFTEAYMFGAFSLIDAGLPGTSYELLQKGFRENPGDYRFPAYLGFFAYTYGKGANKDAVAAQWYQKAAQTPGAPAYLTRIAATLLGKGGETSKAVAMWGQAYMAGDKYSRQRAVSGLNQILPKEKAARMKALAPLVDTMPKKQLDSLLVELFQGYGQ